MKIQINSFPFPTLTRLPYLSLYSFLQQQSHDENKISFSIFQDLPTHAHTHSYTNTSRRSESAIMMEFMCGYDKIIGSIN